MNGCFWHRCPEHATDPRSDVDYWDAKFARDEPRDREDDRALTEAGWRIIHILETEDPVAAANGVEGEFLDVTARRRLVSPSLSESREFGVTLLEEPLKLLLDLRAHLERELRQ